MNLLQMRTMLRRRLKEVTADQWTDGVLDDNLNLGLGRMQLEIMKLNPRAFLSIFKTDIVPAATDSEYYSKPVGAFYDVAIKALQSDASYKPLKAIAYLETLGRTDTDLKYADFDERTFVLSPKPTAAVVDGLRWEGVALLTMAVDTDVPKLNIALHMGIVFFAEIITLGDTAEVSERVQGDLAPLLNSIPQWYQPSGSLGHSDHFTVDVDKGY